jgi:phosphatidylserine/phosphatidylglycerophosphate/cardiolipin synthase-like enzyme
VDAAQAYIDLYHRDGGEADARVVPAAGIPDQFGAWMAELTQLGHAVIHDKIVVVDPFSPTCAVVVGSHNLGYKASYANDENMLIVRGVREVAQAYAPHVLDVYDHYRWRYQVQRAYLGGRLGEAWSNLAEQDDWQDKYFRPDSPYRRERSFWFAEG